MFCLDTNIIIFALNRRRPGIDLRLQQELATGTPLFVPTVVLFELRYGIAKSSLAAQSSRLLDAFLVDGFEIVEFDADDAVEAGNVRAELERAGTPIGPFDILIAAQARRRGIALVTLNRREFERVPGLMVTDWGG